jgi:hypothetical protein
LTRPIEIGRREGLAGDDPSIVEAVLDLPSWDTRVMADHEPEIVTGRPQRHGDRDEPPGEVISHPAKLLRIGAMLKELLEEVRRSSPDEPGRKRLREIYDRALSELKAGLSEDLQHELDVFTAPLEGTPSESEIRIAKAQLIGWLEGLFQGIQAAMWAQQMEARQKQLAEMQRRGLPPGPGGLVERPGPGQYL